MFSTTTAAMTTQLATAFGEIITDSVPLLYFLIAMFLIGLTLIFFMRNFRRAMKNIFNA